MDRSVRRTKMTVTITNIHVLYCQIASICIPLYIYIDLNIFILVCFEFAEQTSMDIIRIQDLSTGNMKSMDDDKQSDSFPIVSGLPNATHSIQVFVYFRTVLYKFKDFFKGPYIRARVRFKRTIISQLNSTTYTKQRIDNSTVSNNLTRTESHNRNIQSTTSYPARETGYIALVTKPEVKSCDNVASCLNPYLSYIAGLMMVFLVIYLIIVFGRCVCDDTY